jgi:hypothetical protein
LPPHDGGGYLGESGNVDRDALLSLWVKGGSMVEANGTGDASIASENSFLQEFGRAFLAWAYIEDALCRWYGELEEKDEASARKIFFGKNNGFDKRSRLLRTTLQDKCKNAEPWQTLLDAALRKADAYRPFRNTLAHGLFVLPPGEGGTVLPMIVDGKVPILDAITVSGKQREALTNAAKNFHYLSFFIRNSFRMRTAATRGVMQQFAEWIERLPVSPDIAPPEYTERPPAQKKGNR